MVGFLVFLALAAGCVGLGLASQATAGVAVIGLGCIFGVLARIAQAAAHHQRAQLTERIDEASALTSATETPQA